MNVEYLIQLLGNRLTALATAKEQAFLTGDLEQINKLDIEINGVVDTLNKLKLLQGISETAAVTPFTEAEVVQNGIEASFGVNNSIVVFDGDPTGILLGYDISSYATDPLHEEKIADILNYIGDMNSPEKIDTYINNEAIGSPVTGAMIYNSAQKYNVDARLMMAIMELDSRFGTAGIAIGTLNPGNVGNDDSGKTRTYSSWQEGVDAVANWLDRHRIESATYVEEQPVEETKVNIEEKKEVVPAAEEVKVVEPVAPVLPEEVAVPAPKPTIEPVIDVPKEEIVPVSDPISRLKQKRNIA